MWTYPLTFDVIVVGGGHAGCEAAHAAAKSGMRTLLLSMNLDTIAKMSCNPAIGGIGKGHVVREIDALGGLMGKVTEETGIQFRMLNRAKGPAVWAPRAQADKTRYAMRMRHYLEQTPNLHLMQGTVEDLLTTGSTVTGIATKEGILFQAGAVIITTGTFLRGLMHVGEYQAAGGRTGDQASVGLSAALSKLGLRLGRLKTGTPPRLHRRSIDFSLTEEQPGEDDVRFSSDLPTTGRLPQVSCHITYTTPATKDIITANLHRSLMYSGKLPEGTVGPRYCPSIEDKVVRFADKERHQIFLEPEGLDTEEIYVNGVSTSLPVEVQYDYIRSIPALRDAQILRAGYAIEYDYVLCGQLKATLEVKHIDGLYLAGQINGTTGYEEAAAQGLMAGINAVCKLKGKAPLILKRSEAYIGVLIDDLITKGLDEPYRIFTSRAEYRLLLRQDNADYRLRHYGYAVGLIDEERYGRLQNEKRTIDAEIQRLTTAYRQINGKGVSLLQLLARPESSYQELCAEYPTAVQDHGTAVNMQIELHAKYEGYIKRQHDEIARSAHTEDVGLPEGLDFFQIKGLRTEAMQKLSHVRPHTLGQAARVAGVSPADITVLRVALTKLTYEQRQGCGCG
jgi:tRNA uridine 5-carboxymethylaminomethyl modification enzyme